MEGEPTTRVWDLPTRVFHWALAALVLFSFVSAKIGGAWTEWHFRSGYTILSLLVFRVLWGFAGSRYARFSSFGRSPSVVWRYLRAPDSPQTGHSPLAALSVLAMLAALLVQGSVGLFANDAIVNEGPLARLVSSAASDRLTTVHRWGEKVLIALVALHLAAVAYQEWHKGRRLVRPMITGDARIAATPARDDAGMRLRGAVLFALAAALVAFVVTR